jgi:hypothetical protein
MFKKLLLDITAIFASVILLSAVATAAGGSKSAFKCELIPVEQYKLVSNSIIFYVSRHYDEPGPYGPFGIRVVPLPSATSPLNHKDVKLNRHILFDDHDVDYANILFLSTEDALYECIGSPPSGDERAVE